MPAETRPEPTAHDTLVEVVARHLAELALLERCVMVPRDGIAKADVDANWPGFADDARALLVAILPHVVAPADELRDTAKRSAATLTDEMDILQADARGYAGGATLIAARLKRMFKPEGDARTDAR